MNYYQTNYITKELSTKIIDLLDNNEWVSISNSANSRRRQQYGYLYNNTTKNASITNPIPSLLYDLAIKLYDDGIFDKIPEQLLVNEYTNKQGIAAHIDSLVFGPTVVTISLLEETEMIFRDKKSNINLSMILEPNSLFIMKDDYRYRYTHEIKKNKSYCKNGIKIIKSENYRRISLTYRTLN